MALRLRNIRLNKTVRCADTDFEIWSAKGYSEIIDGSISKPVEQVYTSVDNLDEKPRRRRRTKAEMLADNED